MPIEVIAEKKDIHGKHTIRSIQVLSETIAASGTATSDDLMPYLAASEGVHTIQYGISGSGTLKIEQRVSCDGTDYADVEDENDVDISELASGLTVSDNNKCKVVKLAFGYGNKIALTETGGSDSVTVDLCIAYQVKED